MLCAVDLETGKIVGDVDIIARGFNLTEDVQASIRNATQETIDAADFDKVNVNDVARLVKKAVRKLFYKDRQFPIIIPIIEFIDESSIASVTVMTNRCSSPPLISQPLVLPSYVNVTTYFSTPSS